jgi:hypothetical protein
MKSISVITEKHIYDCTGSLLHSIQSEEKFIDFEKSEIKFLLNFLEKMYGIPKDNLLYDKLVKLFEIK